MKNRNSSKNSQRFSLYHSEDSSDAFKKWLEPYANIFNGKKNVLDIGCGPGYFLELLQEKNISGFGIDNDDDMVNVCIEKNLNASNHNSNDGLKSLNKKFDGIHAGHLIEHMYGEDVVHLLEDSFDILNDDGILLIRTPNWENETVRHQGFWLDVTHIRPYPLPLLEKLLTDIGFEIIKKGTEEFGWEDIYIAGKKPSSAISKEDLEKLNNKGKDFFKNGNVNDAMECFSKIVEIDPKHTEALNNLGVIAWQKNLGIEAFNFFIKALDSDASNYDALINILECGKDLKRWNELLQIIENYIEIIPDNAILFKYKGEALYNLDRKDEALVCYESVLKAIPEDIDAKNKIESIKKDL